MSSADRPRTGAPHSGDDTAESPMIRIVIADDQRLFVEGLCYILESRASDMKVVATAGNGKEAIAAVDDHRPDLVLMDVRMPELDGVEATEIIHRAHPACRILMLTTFPDDEYVHTALQAGAVGYLLKNRPLVELISSIRAVMDGVMLIDPRVAEALFHRPDDVWRPSEEIVDLIATLTHRER
ncbi:MAG: DNA-binding response regulator, partial [Spirochaetaceae bacterium]